MRWRIRAGPLDHAAGDPAGHRLRGGEYFILPRAAKDWKLAARLLPNPYGRVLVGGALVIVLTLLVGNTNYNGAGMEMVERAVSGDVEPWAWLWKLLFTAVTIGFGYKGGEVVPSFFVGACFGCVQLGGAIGLPAGFGAAIGLVAVFCGAVNCPIASVFLSIGAI